MTHRQLFVTGVSRSGTTVLAAALDAHPEIHMGYELVPPAGLDGPAVADTLVELAAAGARWPRQIGNAVASAHGQGVGQFVKRTARAGAEPSGLASVLRAVAIHHDLSTIAGRMLLANAVVEAFAADTVRFVGHKAAGGYLRTAMASDSTAVAVAIVRDPAAVATSQVLVGMARDHRQALEGWRSWLADSRALGDRALWVRYERLVRQPEPTLRHLSEWLGLAFDPAMVAYEHADVGVLTPGQRHVNDATLRAGFDPNRLERAVDPSIRRLADETCADELAWLNAAVGPVEVAEQSC